MSRITVGEFDRIIKSLYTNDITMAKTIYGEAGQAGLQDKIIKEVTATAGQGAIVNTYALVRENGTEVETSIVDTNTITTVAVNTNILTIEDKGADGNHAYELGINSEQLGDFVKQYDTNTVTTVADDGKGYIGVTDAMDTDGNHNYTVAFDEGKLIQTIEDQDRYVNGGSIGEDGSITLNVHNGRDVTLEGQMKDARLTDIERDKEAGTATLVVKDRYNPEEVNRLTIDDIASKAQMIESMPNSENILMNSIIVLTISAAALTRLVPVPPLSQRCTRWISIPMIS